MTGAASTLDRLLAALKTAPSRTGSVIVTIYGDAILPRGGSLALSDLLSLMARLGTPEGVVRTAVSRLARDGLLVGRKTGRHSAYALTPRGESEFRAAIPRIYQDADPAWDGKLHMAFPAQGEDRTGLEQSGFALLAPGVLISPLQGPIAVPTLEASGTSETMRLLAARAWPVDKLGFSYAEFLTAFDLLKQGGAQTPLDAMAIRTLLIHAFRRIVLRDPRLPDRLLPPDWPGHAARSFCLEIYTTLAPASEAWLDAAGSGSGPLPSGPDPVLRFSGGDTRP